MQYQLCLAHIAIQLTLIRAKRMRQKNKVPKAEISTRGQQPQPAADVGKISPTRAERKPTLLRREPRENLPDFRRTTKGWKLLAVLISICQQGPFILRQSPLQDSSYQDSHTPKNRRSVSARVGARTGSRPRIGSTPLIASLPVLSLETIFSTSPHSMLRRTR